LRRIVAISRVIRNSDQLGPVAKNGVPGAMKCRLWRKAGIELYSNVARSSAVKGRCPFLQWLSRKECRYASFEACAMSAIRSDGCSMPIDSRIVESRTPIFWRMSAGTREWVRLAGRLASDSVPPRLTASLIICSAFKNLNAVAWPPTMSNENAEPAPVHCLANTRPAGRPLRGEQGNGRSPLWRGRSGNP
jgi:hypothetical protein